MLLNSSCNKDFFLCLFIFGKLRKTRKLYPRNSKLHLSLIQYNGMMRPLGLHKVFFFFYSYFIVNFFKERDELLPPDWLGNEFISSSIQELQLNLPLRARTDPNYLCGK